MNQTSNTAYMSPPPEAPPRRTSHLSVRPEGEGADIRELFSDQATSGTRVLSGSVVHVIAVALLLAIARFLPDKVYQTILPQRLPQELVWLVQPGPGGGGGGGNKSPEPPKPAELKGQEKINVPAVKPEDAKPVEPEKIPERPPEPLLNIPVQTMAASTNVSPGDISSGQVSNSNSRGSGTGSGIGPGQGSGLGPGSGGGTGGGVYDIGSGVTPPVAIFQPKPRYTADAMRAKVQGLVVMSAVVMPDGSVTDIQVVRSLDQSFGLDEEAKRTAAQWRFRPGTRLGEPVPVRIKIELEFNLR
jgi:periplasmic protein TonB